MWLTKEQLLDYQRCGRRAYLDHYGDPAHRDPPNPYLQKLRQDSWAHREATLAPLPHHHPDYGPGDWVGGAAATLEAMEQGVDCIRQGVLLAQVPGGASLVSVPDLLVKQVGASRWGDWHYVPVEIRLGKRPKPEYKVILAFHGEVLDHLQDTALTHGWLVLRERGWCSIRLAEWRSRLMPILKGCLQMLGDQREPEVFIARSRCSLCHWYSACYDLAQRSQHLSLLPGVTPNRYQGLQALNLTTVEALAQASAVDLTTHGGLEATAAEQLIRQAQATAQVQVLVNPPRGAGGPALVPQGEVELYFDIEAEPELNVAYLHGLLVVDHGTGTETFHSFCAEDPDQEGDIWWQCLQLMETYPQAPIVHFCDYEVQTIQRLARCYGLPQARTQALIERCWDLYAWVVGHLTLPVENYSLKSIARWLGFSWRDREANGAQSIYWYAQWLETGDRTFLDAILRYNEDDCRATYHIKHWSSQFLTQHLAGENSPPSQPPSHS